ncbi:peptide chain release factor N(5)-glutamine methyltransferase [Methylobacter sp. YRD-M1]|uniref:peptide chain release factor N(5)-glutamine methyltransferase n=1 Tax=Methylobacter sp. YRD-M1 TaxID=2911520 RepID=UPI00227A6A98|nr:peptide chain release factor N(5)-glutamine methyltransferase [Methylobacter sp. YRD-M1]WAK01773.1 peptide chain release factor N(5)-glutamine methyltransferase [Methylobacter sp. YRD-M1]
MHSIKSALIDAVEALAAISDSALLDAEVLLCHVLYKERSYLRAWPDKLLEPEQLEQFWALIERRRQGMPVAYLIGRREFWSRDFHVSPDVLIPRPDTELLVELGLEFIPPDKPFKLIDLGTGSGIIAITLAAERPHAQVIAADFSPAALEIAKHNAQRHHITNVRFYQSDWFDDVPDTQFDLVISNPPYIAEGDSHLQEGDVRFEPQTALVAAQQGLRDIEIIADRARDHLKPQGHLLIEHGYNQQHQVQTIFKGLGYDKVRTYQDLSGQPRVTYGQWNK